MVTTRNLTDDKTALSQVARTRSGCVTGFDAPGNLRQQGSAGDPMLVTGIELFKLFDRKGLVRSVLRKRSFGIEQDVPVGS